MSKSKVFGALIRKTEGSVAVITAIGLVAFLGVRQSGYRHGAPLHRPE